MLKELLVEIGRADYISKYMLASKMNQPLGLIEDVFTQLIRLGFLEEDEGLSTCDLPCGRCPYASMCNTNPIKTINLTKKGQDYLTSLLN
ncbi:MAG: hypothetical protein QM401_01175 [Bacillota bacterium]|nr:hypothetical protein [Bacillota bacterium]HHU60532.1 hypothetical protein [Natronincola sp.]